VVLRYSLLPPSISHVYTDTDIGAVLAWSHSPPNRIERVPAIPPPSPDTTTADPHDVLSSVYTCWAVPAKT